MNIQKRNRGFTLIELLVVITIIAILATVATPMIGKARERARQVPARAAAQSILQSLVLYSGEKGGQFPMAPDDDLTSNAAYRQLLTQYAPSEKMFYQQGSYFTVGVNPEDLGNTDDIAPEDRLGPGKNHWAFVQGLNENDNGSTPIVLDGLTKDGNAYDPKHAWWGAQNAIVGYLDGSASTVTLKIENKVGIIADSKGENLLVPEKLGKFQEGQVLNPVRKVGAGSQ